MPNDLALFESSLYQLAPQFAEVLTGIMPVEKMLRTIVISCDRNPKLLVANRQSLMNAAMSLAVLGLEADGVTGQGFLIPFNKNKKDDEEDDRLARGAVVQPVIGYKGYNTLGARSHVTIAGGIYREGDEFDYDEGTRAFVHHKRKLGGESDRRILAAWATATANDRPPTVKILSVDEILAIKAKSPRGNKEPWAEPKIGFPAMSEKSAKRRLARDMPLSVFQRAARMEEAFEEQGKLSWIHPDKGVVVDGDVIAPNDNNETPTAAQLINPPSKDQEACMAAERGRDIFYAFWNRLSKPDRDKLRPRMDHYKSLVEAYEHDSNSTATEN